MDSRCIFRSYRLSKESQEHYLLQNWGSQPSASIHISLPSSEFAYLETWAKAWARCGWVTVALQFSVLETADSCLRPCAQPQGWEQCGRPWSQRYCALLAFFDGSGLENEEVTSMEPKKFCSQPFLPQQLPLWFGLSSFHWLLFCQKDSRLKNNYVIFPPVCYFFLDWNDYPTTQMLLK